jgi:ubiquinone/menaquinone biosynthesis C-methylase UbiE
LGDTAEYKALSYERLGLGGYRREKLRILDVGCGAGHDCLDIARLGGTSVSVTGIDTSDHLLEVARSRCRSAGLDVRFEEGSVYQIPFSDESFSVCRSDRLFLYLDRPEDALREMCRVLEPEGLPWVRDADLATMLVQARGLDPTVTTSIATYFSDGFPNGWSGRRLCPLLRRAGIRDVCVAPKTLCLPSLKEADALFGIRRTALASADAGTVDREAVGCWLERLDAADREGSFFFSLTFFEAFGRR